MPYARTWSRNLAEMAGERLSQAWPATGPLAGPEKHERNPAIHVRDDGRDWYVVVNLTPPQADALVALLRPNPAPPVHEETGMRTGW